MAEQSQATAPATTQPAAESSVVTTIQQPKTTTGIRKQQFIGWLHRHHVTFLLFAAIFVFLTFIVRDALRENLKELVDSIDKNQATFLSSTEMDDIQRQLKNIGAELKAFEKDYYLMTRHRQYEPEHTVAENNINSLQEQIFDEMTSTLGAWQVVAELPDSQGKAKITQAYVSLNNQLSGLLNDTVYAQKAVMDNVDSGIITVATAALADREAVMRSKVIEFQMDTQNEAVDVREKSKRRYALFTRVSYFLYAGVIVIGLIGRLVGVETDGGD